MKWILLLTLVSSPALACDWVVTKKIDPMTDKQMCTVISLTGKIAFYRNGSDRPNVAVSSVYREPSLQIRVDENLAIRMGENSYDRQKALDSLLPQLQGGKRLRVSYRNYPDNKFGETEVCNLPALLDACTADMKSGPDAAPPDASGQMKWKPKTH